MEDGKIAAHCADLNVVDDWDGLAADVSNPFGAPDILVNAAGVNFRQPAGEITFHVNDRVIMIRMPSARRVTNSTTRPTMIAPKM